MSSIFISPSTLSSLFLLHGRQTHVNNHYFLSPPPPPPPRLLRHHKKHHNHRILYPARRGLSTAFVTGSLVRDAGATALVLSGAYGFVMSFDYLAQRNVIQQKLSRKLVHILSGLIFAISWPLFSNSVEARYFASIVPLVNCFRLVRNGLSLATNEALVKSLTREGNPKELLKGPLYYVLVLILCCMVFWRESPVGLISMAMMCGGDGVADIIGRKFGSLKLPYNQQKSWVGSISMFVFGSLISIGILSYYSALGYFQLDWMWTIQRVALVALVATIVESLPITETVDDNISVPLTSMLTAYLSFGF